MLRQIAMCHRQKPGLVQKEWQNCIHSIFLREGQLLTMLVKQPPIVRETAHIVNVSQSFFNRQNTYLIFHTVSMRYDRSRPVAAAQTFLKIVTRESTLRLLQPFYSNMVRKVLKEEQQNYRSRPGKAISLIWSLFGRENAFQTLTRFYLNAIGRMGSGYYTALNTSNSLYLASGLILQSGVYQKYAQQMWRSTLLREHAVHRYTLRETASVADDYLHRLPLSKQGELEREAVRRLDEVRQESSPVVVPLPTALRITQEEMRLIVKNVSTELERRMRFEAVRRGRL